MKKIILAMIVLCALVAPSNVLAQQTTGNINGRIVDAQGAAVPGVTVTAKSPQTGFTRTDVSDGEGIYRLTALPVGPYDISAELSGFSTFSRKEVVVNVAQTTAGVGPAPLTRPPFRRPRAGPAARDPPALRRTRAPRPRAAGGPRTGRPARSSPPCRRT